ncbi:type II toxin-antitoxin system YafO family toxin [Serratia marcescens]|uniref:type II toxin-antitoxin system YafO family toxin n=1 Tax=Serratia marcescens TaxID=615 RepID=UPI0015D71EDB|nr:type II toxin-antitoxin system YafO family toxin [Serratia marcescens]MBH2979445.1 type II toxin-antitoxin system YafO family toxin [Serratia marcescens]MCX2170660.1 type II toxin-antitoxin system YafO family toxin [Serratia marcescens]MCX2176894.1 type II toxin-antitoxin system YafO family toxin [Serratia marcescens]QLJ62123.1 type II toxin-antitoxin system YafO family toxin [Serratia marcescens]
MFLNEYNGRIFPTGEFKTDDFLITLKEAFKCHWRNGHHPDLGKDTLFDRPEEVLGFHLRKVHVNLGQYASYSYSCTEECWDEWSFGAIDERGAFRAKPTSNAYLIYAVNENRDAALLAYWDPPAHTKANEPVWMESVLNFTRLFHKKTCIAPMSRDIDPWNIVYKVKKPA